MGIDQTAASAALWPHRCHRAALPTAQQSRLFTHTGLMSKCRCEPTVEIAFRLNRIQVGEISL
jgi:hypothetical protein